jgi:hypothetical protein
MAYENLTITIDKDGSVELEYKGLKGKACMDATEKVEQMIGTVTDRQKTADYFKKDPGRKNWLSTGR